MTRDSTNDSLLLHALADGELDAATSIAVEQRVAAEPGLAAEYQRILALKAVVGRLARPPVSDEFLARIVALAPAPAFVASRRGGSRRPWATTEWRAMAASLIVTACLASGITYSLVAPRDSSSIEDAVVSGHRRSLLAASPIDIASSDRHTVRPWFDAKLGLAPPTPDLASLGFPLVGGRVDVIAGRPVPSLVYRHGEHLITVVALPAPPGDHASSAPATSETDGYNVVRWGQSGFAYWAISDLDATELATFVAAMRAH